VDGDDADGEPGRAPFEHGSEEELDEAVEESFPASDPPQSWSGELPGDR
jgi:hypothetical protein